RAGTTRWRRRPDSSRRRTQDVIHDQSAGGLPWPTAARYFSVQRLLATRTMIRDHRVPRQLRHEQRDHRVARLGRLTAKAGGGAVAVPSGSWRELEGDQLGAPRTEGVLQGLPA